MIERFWDITTSYYGMLWPGGDNAFLVWIGVAFVLSALFHRFLGAEDCPTVYTDNRHDCIVNHGLKPGHVLLHQPYMSIGLALAWPVISLLPYLLVIGVIAGGWYWLASIGKKDIEKGEVAK